MMNYDIFKEVVAEKFMDYMSGQYKDMKLEIRPVDKVNVTLDGMNLVGEGDVIVTPTIYINDMYEHYQKTNDLQEIAFIHDAKTDAQRDILFKEMRTGKRKVLIGSTDKCGTGVNVQTHLVAMHHVDCPWKPSSIEQREGRGIRQGNENSEIAI